MFLRQNSRSVTICWMDMLVFWGSVWSWCNFCLTMLIEGSRGIEVKRVLTSYDVITSPGSSYTFWMCCTKCWVFLRWCGERANDVCQLLGHSICNGSPTGHNVPKGGANFVYFGKAIKFWATALVGYTFL